MNQEILIIGRHGKVKRIDGLSTNELSDGSLQELHHTVLPLLRGMGPTKKENVFAKHSSQLRSLNSAKAILIGLLQNGDVPQKIEDLNKYDISGIDISEDPRLNVHYEDVNLEVARRSLIEVTEYWLNNREASAHNGKNITPYKEIKDRIFGCIKDSISKLINENKDLGLIIGHEPYLSIGIATLIEASTGKSLETLPGGTMNQGEFAKVIITENNNLTLLFRNKIYMIRNDLLKNTWWHWLEREDIPVIYCNLRHRAHAFDSRFKKLAGAFLRHLFVWQGKVIHIYYKQEDRDSVGQFLIPRIQSGSSYITRLTTLHIVCGKKLIAYSQKFRNIHFAKKTNAELLEYFKAFDHLYYELSVYTFIPVIGGFALEDSVVPFLKERLGHVGKDTEYGTYFETLTHHPGKSWVRLEEEDLWKLTRKIKNGSTLQKGIQQALRKHAEKWGWFQTAYKLLDTPLTETYFAERLTKQLSDGLKPLPTAKEMLRKSSDMCKELSITRKDARLFKALGLMAYLKEYRDGIYARSHHDLNFLLREVGERFQIAKDDMYYMTLSEFKNLLSGKSLDMKSIQERKQLFVWLWEDKEIWRQGANAASIIRSHVGHLGLNTRDGDMLRGNSASPGMAKGRVKIVHNESELGNVDEGDILVAYMTKPSYLLAMKKAAAFVTNEGGITCHAAIVAREMRKPCVIGTKIATQVLKDGDFVEVDADKGVVKILKPA